MALDITGTDDHPDTVSALTIVLYEPGSSYDHYVYSRILAGEDIGADRNGIPLGDPSAIKAQPALFNSTAGQTGASTSGTGAGTPQAGGPSCGSYCSSINLCSARDDCICIADAWQGVGSSHFTGICKLPFKGRRLDEKTSNGTSSHQEINGTTSSLPPGPLPSAVLDGLACPCNCTYVSKACCISDGIVHEAPSMKLGALQPPTSNVGCNATIGEFEETR